MNVTDDEMCQLVATVWDASLNMRVEPAAGATSSNRARSIVACVQVTGAWNGAVVLDCASDLARAAAGAMFDTDLTKVGLLEMQDAIAELVNMIGGNFKSLLPETCYLSLPSVVEGSDYSTRVPGSKLIMRAEFICMDNALSVALLEKITARSAA
jgi:chemotaxis protein CheX